MVQKLNFFHNSDSELSPVLLYLYAFVKLLHCIEFSTSVEFDEFIFQFHVVCHLRATSIYNCVVDTLGMDNTTYSRIELSASLTQHETWGNHSKARQSLQPYVLRVQW